MPKQLKKFAVICLISIPFIWFTCGLINAIALSREADRAAAPFNAVGGRAIYRGDGASKLTGRAGIFGIVLNGAHLDDSGLEHLREPLEDLPNLEGLYLSDNSITDAGLTSLENLHHLENLVLSKTEVTQEGVRWLQSKLPKCNIFYDWQGATIETRPRQE